MISQRWAFIKVRVQAKMALVVSVGVLVGAAVDQITFSIRP
jgi:hypothetical protein